MFQTFWGPGSEFTLDSSREVTVVTQFITSDGTDTGELIEVRRKWVQDGIVYENSKVNFEVRLTVAIDSKMDLNHDLTHKI